MDVSLKAKIRRWAIRIAVGLVVVPLLGLGLWTWGALSFSYAKGERVGYVQKLSKRGWVCKTFEGELSMVQMPGQPANIFPFTVRDEKVSAAIDKLAGHRVALDYEQHVGLLTTCWGDTEYFVTGVRQTD